MYNNVPYLGSLSRVVEENELTLNLFCKSFGSAFKKKIICFQVHPRIIQKEGRKGNAVCSGFGKFNYFVPEWGSNIFDNFRGSLTIYNYYIYSRKMH